MTERRSRQRRENERRQRDELREHFGQLPARDVDAALRAVASDARIEIRCPAETKSEIESTAGRYGLTVTTYLLRLHELTAAKLRTDSKR